MPKMPVHTVFRANSGNLRARSLRGQKCHFEPRNGTIKCSSRFGQHFPGKGAAGFEFWAFHHVVAAGQCLIR
jgi:hypothetical protein